VTDVHATPPNEQTVMIEVAERLSTKFPDVPHEIIAATVLRTYGLFDGRPVRDFVPLFVERRASAELAQLD
jgi:hypothetical protein